MILLVELGLVEVLLSLFPLLSLLFPFEFDPMWVIEPVKLLFCEDTVLKWLLLWVLFELNVAWGIDTLRFDTSLVCIKVLDADNLWCGIIEFAVRF